MAVWLPWDPRWPIGCIESSQCVCSVPSPGPRAIPRQAIASHPHNKHCITHPQERNVHHMYQEEGPDGYINFQCTHLGHCPNPIHNLLDPIGRYCCSREPRGHYSIDSD